MSLFSKIKNKRNEYNELKEKYNQLEQKYEKQQVEYMNLNKTIASLRNKETEIKKIIDTKSLEYVDQLDGLEFEEYVKKLLIKLGYTKVEKTKASGDFGIDILAEKDNITYAIQCKLYTNKLGIDCVQEAYSGRKYYDKNIAVVITNSFFTQGAYDLAKETGVILWDRNILDNMLKKINGTFKIERDRNVFTSVDELISRGNQNTEDDLLYDQVLEYVIHQEFISASKLQRQFNIGYNRASNLLDLLEGRGIIGPSTGSSKPRNVLVRITDKEMI